MVFALTAAVAMTALGGGALAHDTGHGELTFYDGEEGTPRSSASMAQAPVGLSCQFWLEGTAMSHAEGTIVATPNVPASNLSATLGPWAASEDGNGTYSFEAGPFELSETGVYRLWAQVDTDHRTVAHEVVYDACDGDGGDGEKSNPLVNIE